MLTFNRKYFVLTIIIFVIEVSIALFIKDKIIRPYFGDVLVVALIYCFIKIFFKIKVISAAIFTLLFSFLIEFLQLQNLVELLHLSHSKLARIVLGNTFSWEDMLMYFLGFCCILYFESKFSVKEK